MSTSARRFVTISSLIAVAVITTVVVVSYMSSGDWNYFDIKQSIKNGDIVVQYIYSYHSKFGMFPDDIQSLEREFMIVLPLPCVGTKQWEYWVAPGRQEFDLQFCSKIGTPFCRYDVSTSRWIIDEY